MPQGRSRAPAGTKGELAEVVGGVALEHRNLFVLISGLDAEGKIDGQKVLDMKPGDQTRLGSGARTIEGHIAARGGATDKGVATNVGVDRPTGAVVVLGLHRGSHDQHQ